MTSDHYVVTLSSEEDAMNYGKRLAHACGDQAVIYLTGQLGAGKTTLTRGFLQGLGHEGHVKSPTYTLVESYEFSKFSVHHFDLYRVRDPNELEYMGIKDYFGPKSICVIEWPEYGKERLPSADIHCTITIWKNNTRELTINAMSPHGKIILKKLYG